jgi:hypothetical protein
MESLEEFIDNYIEEHGHSKETFKCIMRDFEDVLANYSLGVKVVLAYDNNDYEEDEKQNSTKTLGQNNSRD